MRQRGQFDLDSVEAVGHVIGMIAVFVGVAGVILSMGLAEDFSVRTGALSDLGDPDRGLSWLFNWSLMLTGALATAFFATLINRFDNRYQRVGTAVLTVASASLLAVGIFPIGHAFHLPVSASFFITLTLGVLISGIGDHQVGRIRRSRVAFNLVLLHVIAWAFAYYALDGVALPELVGALVFAIWIILLVIQRGRDLPA